jgi:hypothetical protein
MAGAGFKTFNTGDVLTASDVNTYLMQQTVMVFDDAAARTTALTGVVAEGMLSYLKDTNAVEVYDGSSWVASDDPNAIQNSIVDAKGDLISATADNTPARLAVGADNTVLTADSSTATGLKWAAAAATGLQTYQQVLTAGSNKSTTSTSFTAIDSTNLRVTATTKSTYAIGIFTGFLSNTSVGTSEWRLNCGSGTARGYQSYNSAYEGTVVPKVTIVCVITGLTADTSYNFDWEWKVNAGTTTMIGDTAAVYPRMVVIC